MDSVLSDEEVIAQYVADDPTCLPENNEALRAAVNHPHYVDREMWGPYGGKHGTVSLVWLDMVRDEFNGSDD